MKSTGRLIVIFFLAANQFGFGQAKMRKLPTNLNHPSISNFAPFVSLDGNSMVYIADVGEDNALTMNYTARAGVDWKDPVTMPKVVNNRLNFMKGFALSANGKTLYLTNIRGNGVGGFDLYTSQLSGTTWGEPVNMFVPVNSKGHDACPSVTLDGATLFFMRCEKMDFTKAEGCRIVMMRKRNNGQWEEPVDLPNHVNTGNSQSPRILGDGETLIFSSDKIQPNKGGMDLYITRLSDGQWTNPLPLDFANTPGDDQYVSATAAGMYLLKEVPGAHNSELVELLFPPEVRPKSTLKVEGKVGGTIDPSTAFVTVFNRMDQQRVFSTKPEKDGTFIAYMNVGGWYDLSVEPAEDHFTFYSKIFDLRGQRLTMIDRVQATLGAADPGAEVDLDGIIFYAHSADVSAASTQELRRLVRLIQGNPQKSFAIEVTLQGFQQDSVRSSKDLTETAYDTTRIPVTYQVDSATTATRDSLVIKTRYHNNRTLRQAKAIEEYLVGQGIAAGRLACSGKAELEAVEEKRRTFVRVIVH